MIPATSQRMLLFLLAHAFSLLLDLIWVRHRGDQHKDLEILLLREGIGTLVSSPWLWMTISVTALTNVTLSGPYAVALPFLITDHFHADVRMLGLLYAMFPIGYVIGGVWLGRSTRLRRRGLTAYCGLIVAGLGMLARPANHDYGGWACSFNKWGSARSSQFDLDQYAARTCPQ
jgi:hypothetical protein